MPRCFLLLSSLTAFLAVAMGAFGAHGLRGSLDEHEMAIYQTAVHYQFWHALGLGLIALLAKASPGSALLRWAGGFMILGVVAFSGSLYARILTGIGSFGLITPFGGLAFMVSWLLVAIHAWYSADTGSDRRNPS